MSDVNTPIIVVVADGRYDCYGPDTPRSHFLEKLLAEVGGISDQVEEGTYHFNLQINGGDALITLTRFEE